MHHTHGKAATDVPQPDYFVFNRHNLTEAERIIARYPSGRQQSAVMPLLTLAQKQHDNWLPKAAMDYIADMLGMPPIKVYEVATFYTMYNVRPVGRYHVQLCTTTPCWLRGSDGIAKACEHHLGVRMGETTFDGMFTLSEAECLGACVNAPMMQVSSAAGDAYFEDLTPENVTEVLDGLAAGRSVTPGSQSGRISSEPAGGLTSLKDTKRQAG